MLCTLFEAKCLKEEGWLKDRVKTVRVNFPHLRSLSLLYKVMEDPYLTGSNVRDHISLSQDPVSEQLLRAHWYMLCSSCLFLLENRFSTLLNIG